MKATIGIATYNGVQRVKKLLSSIYNYTENKDLQDVRIVVIDDGTPYKKETEKLEVVCDHFQAMLLKHGYNKGISASWNTLSRCFDDVDLIVLFNDDVQICHSAWLQCIKYFLRENEKIGHVSLPTFNIDPQTALPRFEQAIPDITINPYLSWTPNGQGFAFKKVVYDEIKGGFWEELTSFYEETDFGYELAHKGYMSYVLPFPVIQHWGSQTFALNSELTYTTPDASLPLEKYRELLKSKFSDVKIEPYPGKVYRMEFSRVKFALKWGCKDIWDQPQNEIEARLSDRRKQRLIKWLDKDGLEKEMMI